MTEPRPQVSRPQLWLQSTSGGVIDLMAPSLDGRDPVRDLIEPIARTTRFTGHVPAGPYSVAQHCVIGCDFALYNTGDAGTAAAVLLHDLHEAFLGDIATPVAAAIARETGDVIEEHDAGLGTPARDAAHTAVRRLKARIDACLYRAAGLPWPLPADIARYVAAIDLRLLATERLHLLARSPQAWAPAVEAAEPLPLPRRLRPWPWKRAAAEYHARVMRFCPALIEARPRFVLARAAARDADKPAVALPTTP